MWEFLPPGIFITTVRNMNTLWFRAILIVIQKVMLIVTRDPHIHIELNIRMALNIRMGQNIPRIR